MARRVGVWSKDLGGLYCEAWCKETVVSQGGQHHRIQHQDDAGKESGAQDEDAFIRSPNWLLEERVE